MIREPVKAGFFRRPTLELARALLGTELVHCTPEGETYGRIVEVEAYMGPYDKAAHSYTGRRTARTEVMFGPPGRAYVYFIYGMYDCLNVVSGPEGSPEAILVRALEPTGGLDLMSRRRGMSELTPRRIRHLTSGPGKLCRAMGITRAQYGGDLTVPPLFIRHDQDPIPPEEIETGPRINIDYAEEARDFPWRFWISGNAYVSVD